MPGETSEIGVAIPMGEDLEELIYAAGYNLSATNGVVAGSDTGVVNFKIKGVKVEMTPEFDRRLYRAGETAYVDLIIKNIGSVVGKTLNARVEYLDVTIDPIPFVLPSDSITIPVEIPLSATGGQLLYEVYTPGSGMVIYLNTAFIQERPVGAELVTDKQDYAPGENVVITVLAERDGTIKINEPFASFSTSLDVLAEYPQSTSFTVPLTAITGTREITYEFEGTQHKYLYNVAGIKMEVSSITFDKLVYRGEDTVRADFLITSNEAFAGTLNLRYIAPDGTELSSASYNVSAVKGKILQITGCNIETTLLGSHMLEYKLSKSVAGTNVLLSVGEAFYTVGGSSLSGISTGKGEYESGIENVDAMVYLSSVEDTEGLLEIFADGESLGTEKITATKGFYSHPVVIDKDVFEGPGIHQITAVFKIGDLESGMMTEFVTSDTISPTISINGVAEGGKYNTLPLILTFTGEDKNLYLVFGALNGKPYVSGTPITSEGDYSLEVTASDLSGNSTTKTVNFTLVSTPVITVTGISHQACYKNAVSPVFVVTGAHLSTSSATLNGAEFISGATVSAEGAYELAVTAVDKFGEKTLKTMTFNIDRTDPFISISGVEDGIVYEKPVTPLVIILDNNLTESSMKLNGNDYTNGTYLNSNGDYILNVHAADCAGNTSDKKVSFVVRMNEGDGGCSADAGCHVCMPGDIKCWNEEQRAVCVESGETWNVTDCQYGHRCKDGVCRCEDFDGGMCSDGGSSHTDGGLDASVEDAGVESPDGGSHVPVCKAGETFCFDERHVAQCSDDEMSYQKLECEAGHLCRNGTCLHEIPTDGGVEEIDESVGCDIAGVGTTGGNRPKKVQCVGGDK